MVGLGEQTGGRPHTGSQAVQVFVITKAVFWLKFW